MTTQEESRVPEDPYGDHPETKCDICGGSNPVWSIDSDRWNLAVGKQRGLILCPSCFVRFYEEATGMRCCWTLVPAGPFKWI